MHSSFESNICTPAEERDYPASRSMSSVNAVQKWGCLKVSAASTVREEDKDGDLMSVKCVEALERDILQSWRTSVRIFVPKTH